eukprot:PLAT11042.1.p1 GENE.PLAT11042.1~~PLAT11042.1.p1  ORF type:complete len:407 (-),score=160.72 PLAT11042.1:77-1150(-)
MGELDEKTRAQLEADYYALRKRRKLKSRLKDRDKRRLRGLRREFHADFEPLELEEVELERFYEVFLQMDKDMSGEIDFDEFANFFDLHDTPFARRMFYVTDTDGSGQLDFREFVVTMWNFCSLDAATVSSFGFRLFDLDNSGMLDQEEVEALIQEVYGEKLKNNMRVRKVLRLLDRDGDGEVSFDEFRVFSKHYPVLMYPAVHMQRLLRAQIIGEPFWARLQDSRVRSGTMETGKDLRPPNLWEILFAVEDRNRFRRRQRALQSNKKWLDKMEVEMQKLDATAFRLGAHLPTGWAAADFMDSDDEDDAPASKLEDAWAAAAAKGDADEDDVELIPFGEELDGMDADVLLERLEKTLA